jgi:spore maturation protein CgeB
MRFVLFYHSLLSDWNHGNAHFLRGVVTELLARGHDVRVYEPHDAWSVQNLVAERGPDALREFQQAYPRLSSTRYAPATLDLDTTLEGADVVIVHEWNPHDLVAGIGQHRQRTGEYRLLFHDTHHRAVTQPEQMAAYDLSHYDGVLAFGDVLRDMYLLRRWARRAWTWHEAADTRVFRPSGDLQNDGDLVWIGNWGDDERTAELHEFLLDPIKQLGLRARIHGVRYPDHARQALADAGIEYGGYLPNFLAPALFGRFAVTVHVPRRPYTQALPGIPTIRVFEALACGIPLVSAPWTDAEHLFEPGKDFLVARDGAEMTAQLRRLLSEPDLAQEVSMRGRRTILARHTCAHRVDELLKVVHELGDESPRARRSRPRPRTKSAPKSSRKLATGN